MPKRMVPNQEISLELVHPKISLGGNDNAGDDQ
jgi:hypothetical protein